MSKLNILVCITHVPDTAARIAFDAQAQNLLSDRVQFVIGPYDDYALARAVELKGALGGEVSVCVAHVGDVESESSLRKALAIGADKAIRVAVASGTALDAYGVAQALAHLVQERGPFDLILLGRESSDGNQGLVAGMLSDLLGITVVSPVMRLEIENIESKKGLLTREIVGGTTRLEAPLPLILGCQEPIAEWKIPNMRDIMGARTKPLEVLDYEVPAAQSTLLRYDLPKPREDVRLADTPQELVRLLRKEAKVI